MKSLLLLFTLILLSPACSDVRMPHASDTNTHIDRNANPAANNLHERCELDRRRDGPVGHRPHLWMGNRGGRHEERGLVADHPDGRFGDARRRHAELADG